MIHKWSILENNSNRGWCLGWCFFLLMFGLIHHNWFFAFWIFLDVFGIAVFTRTSVWFGDLIHCQRPKRRGPVHAEHYVPRQEGDIGPWAIWVWLWTESSCYFWFFFSFGGVKMSKVSPFFEVNDLEPTRVFFCLELQQLILHSSPVKNVHPPIPMDKWVPFQLH